ncbi:esterase/lipase superfamily enzyme [Bradyrhizobium sp. LA6.1]|uniref:alpha/beta hydrolase n=1 Tax=Bradyrhizobium sp. LA6.1 TaxID=3156378 RepID=UPI003398988F
MVNSQWRALRSKVGALLPIVSLAISSFGAVFGVLRYFDILEVIPSGLVALAMLLLWATLLLLSVKHASEDRYTSARDILKRLNYPPGVIGIQKVMFATNRRMTDTVEGTSLDLEKITHHFQTWLYYGRAWVTIPAVHRIGTVERPRRIWKSLWLLKEAEEPAKHFTLAELSRLKESDFFEEISQASAKSALVFVHGFNVSFSDALFRAAQIGYDTNFRGEVIAFCWPSRASVELYDADRERALASHYALLDLLNDLRRKASIENIFLVAHSLGSQIVVGALSAINSRLGEGALGVEELVLGAPDVDRDVFVSSGDFIKSAARGITIYASSADKALIVSRLKAGGVPRVGDVPPDGPLLIQGVDVIDVTALGEDMFALNHGVFISDRSVLDDLGRIITSRTRPPHDRTTTLRQVPPHWRELAGRTAPDYWVYPR